MDLNPIQNWSVNSYGLVIFLILALFWLSETGQIWGSHGENDLKFCMLMYFNNLRNWLVYDHGLVIFLILALFRLSEMGQIWCFRPFWSCSHVKFPYYGAPWNWSYLGFPGIIWRLCGGKCRGGVRGILPTLCLEFCVLLYIISQNNPVSNSLGCKIPWFFRNRSYRRRAPRYRRHVPSYRRHPVKLPSSVISVNFAYRRLAADLSGIIVQIWERVRVCRFGARCTMHLCFSVVNLREIGGRNKTRAGKNFSKRAAASAPSWRR